jgi:hypothetical protein
MTMPASDQPVVPDWLAAAEAARPEQHIAAQGVLHAQRHADLINARLADLGIDPIEAAGVDDRGNLRPARLTKPESEPYAYYEVRAVWSEGDKQVELHTAYWEGDRPVFGRVRLLYSLADVAAARRETSTFGAPNAITDTRRSVRWTASFPTASTTPTSKRSRRPSTAVAGHDVVYRSRWQRPRCEATAVPVTGCRGRGGSGRTGAVPQQ